MRMQQMKHHGGARVRRWGIWLSVFGLSATGCASLGVGDPAERSTRASFAATSAPTASAPAVTADCEKTTGYDVIIVGQASAGSLPRGS